jgi:hypothetical protein
MLREFFDNRLINRNTENIWPPRFSDLTPAAFFCGLIYSVHNLQDLCPVSGTAQ